MAFFWRRQAVRQEKAITFGQETREERHGMKLRMNMLCRAGAWIGICLATLIFAWQARAAAVSTTTVQGTVYLANGAVGSGTLQLSWPAFTTADNLAVAAGRTTVSIGADGFVSVNLAPNLGAAPAGLYYTAVYHMSDGTTSTEYWVVPEAAQASLAAVRAQVMPAAQAVQAASKAYVDNAIASLAQGTLTPVGGALSGPLYLNGDPTQTLQAADKHYVDSTFSASVPLAGGTMLGALTGPSVTASLNKVLLVTAPPYNAQCDGVTDDQAAIQAAFNDAYTNGYSVEFPAGTCLTSTITIKGQSFFGHGKYVTTIVGRPGQDVFATPDPSTSPVFRQSAHIHDLSIQVNATVDASASAAGGNNMFPYRVTGTAGGLTALPQAPAPGPMVFGSAVPGNCAGQMIADSSGAFDEFYQPCANFTNLNAEFNGAHMAGQPISVYNTSGALVLATTIASVIDATHLQLAAPASAAQSNLSGEYMNALTAPWYIGNCGFAFPMADGSQNGGGNGSLNGWVFENISIGQVSTSLRQPNHTCGIFMQANNYALNYEHVDTSMLYGGIIEALPYQNGSYVTWAPDTTKYLDVNLSHHILPFITYNGTHRIVEGMSIYGGAWDSPQGMGAWMLAASTGTSSGLAAYAANASLSRFYFECASFLSGEVERFSGQSTTLIGGSPTQCGDSGSLGPWMTPAYLNWDVSDGSLDGQVGIYLQINGDHNSLTHTDLTLGSVTDNGFENRVQTGINNSDANLKRAFYANLDMPQDPVGKLTGDFLLNGDSGAPFVSGSDLLTTCRDYRTLTPLCVNDPGGSELSRSYIHALATAGSVSGISTGSVASWNALMVAGSRIPLTQVYVVAQGRCQGAAACSSTFYVRDRVTGNTLGNCTYTFGSSWTVQGGASSNPCLINFSGVPMGDAVGWDTNAWTASGLTAVDISFVGFQPQHPDIVSEVLTSGQLAGVIQSGAAGVPVNITAANWHWGSTGPGVVDASSPTGYSTAIGNAWSLTAWNGSTNLNGGALYPAVPSTISYLVQAPAVLTNSLAAAMAATDTSFAVSVPVTSSYASGGCFQSDQEIGCYSGTPTAGATTIAVSRGQYGTLPQAHASGATVNTVGTGTFFVACNGTNYASTNVVFGANWSYVSSPFAAQNCSGASTAIHLSFANGPTGQTYKIAAVQIAQNS
ncbi:MAG: glycosyl hydrolase family 28-related protein, partial [Terracidiphilus sp.]